MDEHVKRRYLQEISVIGVDYPDLNADVNLDAECLPPIESMDIFSYLVLGTSFYTKEQINLRTLKAWRLTNG